VATFELPAMHTCTFAAPRSRQPQLLQESKRQKGENMKQGDYVKVTGMDGFYVFLKEIHGMATLRVCSTNDSDRPTITIAIDRVVSLPGAN
jgi:hypothetical protein